MSWRDARGCANHLDIGEATFLAMVRCGKFPRASYHLGPRLPRWSTEALDSVMNGATMKPDKPGETFDGLGAEIAAENQNRETPPRGRQRQGIHV